MTDTDVDKYIELLLSNPVLTEDAKTAIAALQQRKSPVLFDWGRQTALTISELREIRDHIENCLVYIKNKALGRDEVSSLLTDQVTAVVDMVSTLPELVLTIRS